MKIVFCGDGWLQKIHLAFDMLAPEHETVFVDEAGLPEGRALPASCEGADAVVASHGALPGGSAILSCPRFFLDGLASLELHGGTILGSEAILEDLEASLGRKTGRASLATSVVQGEVDFRCVERFARSMDAIADQENGGLRISDLILDRYRSEDILQGVDRPNPVLTLATAARIAEALAVDPAPFRSASHWQTAQLAFRQARYALIPHDAARLGLAYERDPYWYGSAQFLVQEQRKMLCKADAAEAGDPADPAAEDMAE